MTTLGKGSHTRLSRGLSLTYNVEFTAGGVPRLGGQLQEILRFRVTGRVQGVGFRFFVEREARELGVDGWVRNCNDGTVEVHAEARTEKMNLLRAALVQGPPASRVEQVSELPAARLGCKGFSIEATK
jgi:acylphosphatase